MVDIDPTSGDLADVDHVFPHVLGKLGKLMNIDGVWNLVLACRTCNRGPDGKFDYTPHPDYVSRLNKRNEYLILSHHPLRETLMKQSGLTVEARRQFLQSALDVASTYSPKTWYVTPVGNPEF
jgi:hypothetical protein